MDLFVDLAAGLRDVCGWLPLVTILAGVVLGILAGAMPGISPSMGVALLVPFTYTMSPSLRYNCWWRSTWPPTTAGPSRR